MHLHCTALPQYLPLLETEQNNLLSITSSLVTKQVTQNITSHSSLSLSLYSFKFNYQSDILRHLFSPSTVTIPNTPLTFITFYHFATYLFNAVTPWLPTTTIHIHSFIHSKFEFFHDPFSTLLYHSLQRVFSLSFSKLLSQFLVLFMFS
jgi:hypothetical protein